MHVMQARSPSCYASLCNVLVNVFLRPFPLLWSPATNNLGGVGRIYGDEVRPPSLSCTVLAKFLLVMDNIRFDSGSAFEDAVYPFDMNVFSFFELPVTDGDTATTIEYTPSLFPPRLSPR